MLGVDEVAGVAVEVGVRVGVDLGSWCRCLPVGMYHCR